LILRKIIENAATRCHILKLKYTKFDSAGDPSQTLLGELTASPGPLAGFKGPTSKGRKDGKEGQGKEGKKEGNGGEGRGGNGEGSKKKGEGEGLRHGCWGMDAPDHHHWTQDKILCMIDCIQIQ